MDLPPAVTVHGLEHARAALAPGLPVTLLSGPAAGVYAGAGWWLAVVAAACGSADRECANILDCGEAAGRALEACRAGQKRLVLRAPPAILAEVRRIASEYGAVILEAPPPSLDLAERGALRLLVDWLAGHLSARGA